MPRHASSASPPTFPPSGKLSLLITLYELLWHLLMPLVLLFLWRRGKREPLYRQFWSERWGRTRTALDRPLWVHSASMGEMRGAAPLVRALLDAGYPVVDHAHARRAHRRAQPVCRCHVRGARAGGLRAV
ncbi:MAG: glycosyltransferase N-terminal domain-containing protein [Hydrogenophaga sp.]|nr:glycosyltransferase N-terminal domain-containing protein [Hydrogenophaga sp.]